MPLLWPPPEQLAVTTPTAPTISQALRDLVRSSIPGRVPPFRPWRQSARAARLRQVHDALLQTAPLGDPADAHLVLQENQEHLADHRLGVALLALDADDQLAPLVVEVDARDGREIADGCQRHLSRLGPAARAGRELDAHLFVRGRELRHRSARDEAPPVEDGRAVADLLELLQVVARDDD